MEIRDRLGDARARLSVFVHASVDKEQLSDHKPMTPSGMGLLVCVSRVAPLLSPWRARGECANGSEHEPVLQFRIMYVPLAQR